MENNNLKYILMHPTKEITNVLQDYHAHDIASVFEELDKDSRLQLYNYIDLELLSEIITFCEDPSIYLEELGHKKTISLINEMDIDDVVDVLEDLQDDDRDAFIKLLDKETQIDIALIDSYDDNQIGSKMTTNFNSFSRNLSIKDAMRLVVSNAGENDNINIVYCYNDDKTYYGAIHLRDLIVARSTDNLESIIRTNYPILYATDRIDDVLENIKDYTLEYLPVLDSNNHLLGIITHEDIIEVMDEEMSEDYSKFAGLTTESEANEPLFKAVRKRLPWLFILLLFDLFIAGVVSGFENLIALFPIIAAFQSLLLGMSGNSGTQSLAVTILSLSDEELTWRYALKTIFKEIKIGFSNGLICGAAATILIGMFIILFKQDSANIIGYGTYIDSFIIGAIVGLTLVIGMTIASLVGCIIPMFFKKIHVDPATASGPFITTLNDIITVSIYFGTVTFLFSLVFHIL